MANKEEHRDAQFLEEIESLREEIAAEQTRGDNASRKESSSTSEADKDTAESTSKPKPGNLQAKAEGKEKKLTGNGNGTEDDESLRSALRELKNFTDDDDEDTSSSTHKMTLASILGGDILAGAWFRKQFFYIVMVIGMIIVYISNRYNCQQQLIEQKSLNDTLLDRRFKALTRSSQLKERMRRGYIEEVLTDTTLQTSNTPSFNLKVDEE